MLLLLPFLLLLLLLFLTFPLLLLLLRVSDVLLVQCTAVLGSGAEALNIMFLNLINNILVLCGFGVEPCCLEAGEDMTSWVTWLVFVVLVVWVVWVGWVVWVIWLGKSSM